MRGISMSSVITSGPKPHDLLACDDTGPRRFRRLRCLRSARAPRRGPFAPPRNRRRRGRGSRRPRRGAGRPNPECRDHLLPLDPHLAARDPRGVGADRGARGARGADAWRAERVLPAASSAGSTFPQTMFASSPSASRRTSSLGASSSPRMLAASTGSNRAAHSIVSAPSRGPWNATVATKDGGASQARSASRASPPAASAE